MEERARVVLCVASVASLLVDCSQTIHAVPRWNIRQKDGHDFVRRISLFDEHSNGLVQLEDKKMALSCLPIRDISQPRRLLQRSLV